MIPHDLDHLSLGFNREHFIHDILEPRYNANISRCARDLGLKPNSLRDILCNNRNAGTTTLSCLYRYCVRNNLNPTRYIFVFTTEGERKEESV